MPGSEFRQAGYRLIDQIADFIDNIGDKPVTTNPSSAELSTLIGLDPLPEDGKPANEIVNRASGLLFNHSLFNGQIGRAHV